MRKLVLLLFFLILFLLYSACSDCPTVDNITSGKILEDFKGFFDLDSSDDANQNTESAKQETSIDENKEGYIRGTENNQSNKITSEITDELTDVQSIDMESLKHGGIDDESEGESRKLLDLTLPQFVDDVMDMSIFKHEYKSMLPDLFTPVEVEEEESRTSFGGRVLMDEGFEEFNVDELRLQDIRGSIEGAEITLEVKTN